MTVDNLLKLITIQTSITVTSKENYTRCFVDYNLYYDTSGENLKHNKTHTKK